MIGEQAQNWEYPYRRRAPNRHRPKRRCSGARSHQQREVGLVLHRGQNIVERRGQIMETATPSGEPQAGPTFTWQTGI